MNTSTPLINQASFGQAVNDALANPYTYLAASASAIDGVMFESGDLFRRVADFAENAASKRIDAATRSLLRGNK